MFDSLAAGDFQVGACMVIMLQHNRRFSLSSSGEIKACGEASRQN
jgi:hypothetical protein